MLSAVVSYAEFGDSCRIFGFIGLGFWYEEAWRGVENSGSQTLL
jgi:hypothetical protein